MTDRGATEKTRTQVRIEVPRGEASHAKRLSVSQYVEGIRAGDRSVLAKAITLSESSHPVDRNVADEVLETCSRGSTDAIVAGITGIPGAGKSCLIEALGRHIITEHDERVAVLVIDPSSRLSGGSILGDKLRMPFLASSEMAFIRPSPSGASLGGVAARTRDAIALCKAAGYRNVLIETVGVGQAETSVRDMVDFLLLVAIAGTGDELQGIKRGVMEMVDAIVVNKADGDNFCGAEKARGVAEAALHYFPVSTSGWCARALVCSAKTGLGVRETWSLILEHHRMMSRSGDLERLRCAQNLAWLHESLERGLKQRFMSDPEVQKHLIEVEQKIAAGNLNPVAAARQLLSTFSPSRDERHGRSGTTP